MGRPLCFQNRKSVQAKYRVPSRCCECGGEITIAHNRIGRSDNLCPDCSTARRRERRHQEVLARQQKDLVIKRTQDWRIIKDPDESWGTHTVLAITSIKEYARMGYLCKGVAFKNEGSGKVVRYNGRTLVDDG